jgi:hypothetical protein
LATEEPGRELAMAYSNRSQLHMLANEFDRAIEWGERARELADRLGDVETLVHASINVITARLDRGDPTAAVAMRSVHADAAVAGLADHAARALVNLASSLVGTWEYVAGAAALDEAFAYASAHDLGGYSQHLLGVLAGARLERCEWDAALAAASESLDRPARFGSAVVPALLTRGRILAARGLDGALSMLDIAADHAYGIGELQWIGPRGVGAGRVLPARGRSRSRRRGGASRTGDRAGKGPSLARRRARVPAASGWRTGGDRAAGGGCAAWAVAVPAADGGRLVRRGRGLDRLRARVRAG